MKRKEEKKKKKEKRRRRNVERVVAGGEARGARTCALAFARSFIPIRTVLCKVEENRWLYTPSH